MLSFLVSLCFLRLVVAGPGVGNLCCNMALDAYKDGSLVIPQNNYVCNQTYAQAYAQGSPPAPDLKVPTSWCRKHCGKYILLN